jgi:hypothetical protein
VKEYPDAIANTIPKNFDVVSFSYRNAKDSSIVTAGVRPSHGP